MKNFTAGILLLLAGSGWSTPQFNLNLGQLLGAVTNNNSPTYIPSLEREECGLSIFPTRPRGPAQIYPLGSEDTTIGEFPFLALLGNKRDDGTIFWGCGGTIINRWYVLSSASCGYENTELYVRLGEWKVVDDPRNKTDCKTVDDVRTCTEPYQDIAVADFKIHPDFTLTSVGLPVNDIKLVKLAKPAVYNDFVRPVCLPSPSLAQYGEPEAPIFGSNLATTVGWGITSYRGKSPVKSAPTDIQHKLEMPAVDNEDCLTRWRQNPDLSGELSPDILICAGGEVGKDICNGDSGGPLLARKNRFSPWQVVGVNSAGSGKCGIGVPAIFTRVNSYVHWIRDNLDI